MMGTSPLFSSKKIVFKPALSGLFFAGRTLASGVPPKDVDFWLRDAFAPAGTRTSRENNDQSHAPPALPGRQALKNA
jgi:hypothetical protein